MQEGFANTHIDFKVVQGNNILNKLLSVIINKSISSRELDRNMTKTSCNCKRIPINNCKTLAFSFLVLGSVVVKQINL